MNGPFLRSKKGFSLPETVICLALLVIVWIPVVEAFIISKASGSLAKHRVQAAYVAQRAIEDIHRKSFSLLTAGSASSTVSIDTRGTPDSTTGDLFGTQVITITNTSTYYKKILVEVRWNERLPGVTKTMREYCATFITNDAQAN